MNGIKVLIVIYNKPLINSLTYDSIKAFQGLDITIADNSTKDFGNEAFAKKMGCRYISMQGNQGLSKAYNRVISTLDINDDLLCLFDDDSNVGENYFSTLRKAFEGHKNINLFAPIVKDDVGILSPCMIKGVKVMRISDTRNIPKNNISFINSGLAIRMKVFKNYKYDEGQFLDYIDHAFIHDIISNDGTKVHILEDVIIKQHFSGSEKSSRAADKERFEIFKKDVGYFCKKFSISKWDKEMLLLKRRLSLFIKHL